MKKEKIFLSCIFLILQVTLLIYFGVSYINSTDEVININYHDLIGTTIPDDRDGWYVDASFPLTEDGMFDKTIDFEMTPGMYYVIVNYETDIDSNYTTVSADTSSPFGLRVDKIPLNSRVTSVMYPVYLLQKTNNFCIENYYGGYGYLIIRDITIIKTRLLYRIELFLYLTLFLFIDLILFGIYKRTSLNLFLIEKRINIFILIGALAAFIPMLDTGMYFEMDCGFHLSRIEGIASEIQAGQFPVKLQTDWIDGYGYAPSLYYGDLFLIIASGLRMIGFSLQFSYKVLIFAINLATMGIMYWCSHKISNDEKISYVCALFYTLFPYRLLDVYSRCALGESIALTFYPLIVYGFLEIYGSSTDKNGFDKLWIPLSIGFSGIIESHMLSCVMFAEIIIILCLIHFKKTFEKKRFIVLLKTVIYTTLLNAWFIIPCITSMDHLDITQPYRLLARIQDMGNTWDDLLINPQKGIGLACILTFILFVFIMTSESSKKISNTLRTMGKHIFILSIITCWMSMKIFPWNFFSSHLGKATFLVSNIQFQSRYTGIAAVFITFLLCIALMEARIIWNANKAEISIIAIVFLSFISAINFYESLDFERTTVYSLQATGRTYWNIGEYIYYEETNNTVEDFLRTKINETKLLPNQFEASENIQFSDYQKDHIYSSFYCQNISEKNGYIDLPLLFYSQYLAEDENGNELQVTPGTNSKLRIIIPPNTNGTIYVHFETPLLWDICEWLSLLTLIILIVYGFTQKKKNYPLFTK